MQAINITDIWDDSSYGLTVADLQAVPTKRGGLDRSPYAAKLQLALDKGMLMLPVHAIALGTLYGTPDGQPPVGTNQMTDSLLLIAGSPGAGQICRSTTAWHSYWWCHRPRSSDRPSRSP